MTPGDQIFPAHMKRAKRKRMLSMSAAMKLTSYVIKKFREIIIEDDIESVSDTIYIEIRIDRLIKSTK